MLARHIVGYAPANVVPAIVSFLSIYVFTRLVSPQEYGKYAVVLSVTLMCQALFFYWLQVGATRFVARAMQEGGLDALVSTAYRLFFASSLVFASLYALSVVLFPSIHALRSALWLGLPLVLARSLTALNQAFNRGELRVLRYNMVECCQSVFGFIFGWVLVKVFAMEGAGILLGIILGTLVMSLPGAGAIGRSISRPTSRDQGRLLLRFGLPLTFYCAMNYMLATSDRLLVEYFLGPAAVGVYSVSYNTMDRALTSVFLAVSLASFPLAIAKLEREGVESARRQVYGNGTALLALGLPACAGLIVLNQHIAVVLIGERFRAQALEIMPWIAGSSLLAGFQVHFFDHAFHLGRRTELAAWSVGPAVVVNILLNVLLLPRIGLMGAVYATIGGYVAALCGSIGFGRTVFRIDFPFRPVLRIVAATVVMISVLKIIPAPATVAGLCVLLLAGVTTYAAASLLFDVAGARSLLSRRLARRRFAQ